MKIRLHNGLPYVTVALSHAGRGIELGSVLLDTGSAGTVFSADAMLLIGLQYEADDVVHRIQGIGGAEFVFTKCVSQLAMGDLVAADFEVEVGMMEYGIDIDGIVGTDFLVRVGAVIDLSAMEIHPCMVGR